MTYRCEICNSVTAPNQPVQKITEYCEVDATLMQAPTAIESRFLPMSPHPVTKHPHGSRSVIKPIVKQIVRELKVCPTCHEGHSRGTTIQQLIATRRPCSPVEAAAPAQLDIRFVPIVGQKLLGQTIRCEDTEVGTQSTNEVCSSRAVKNIARPNTPTKPTRKGVTSKPPTLRKKKSTDDLIALEEGRGKAGKSVRVHTPPAKRGKQQDRKG